MFQQSTADHWPLTAYSRPSTKSQFVLLLLFFISRPPIVHIHWWIITGWIENELSMEHGTFQHFNIFHDVGSWQWNERTTNPEIQMENEGKRDEKKISPFNTRGECRLFCNWTKVKMQSTVRCLFSVGFHVNSKIKFTPVFKVQHLSCVCVSV